MVVRTDVKYSVGDQISFGLEKFNVYRDGILEQVKTNDGVASSEANGN
jgi:hypothetical protein